MPLLLPVVVNNQREKGLAVDKFGGIKCIGSRKCYPWSAIIRHVLWAHWPPIEIQVLFEMRVKAYILVQTRPIIHLSKVDVIPMNDAHVPTHKPHFQVKDGWVVTFIG
jgi:hypothetical protein